MASYLSDEWFDEMAAIGVSGPEGAQSRSLVLEHLVTGGPVGDVWYHLSVDAAGVTVRRGRAAAPDVTFTEDYATAAAVAQGTLSAPAALLGGRIRVGGDLAALVAHQDILSVPDPIPAPIRRHTTY